MRAISAIGERRAPRRHLRTPRSGFTLIELLVALTIMVLLASSIPVALNRMLPGRRLGAAADQLIADIRWLQERAVLGGETTRLVLLPTGYSLDVRSESPRNVTLARGTSIRLRGGGEQRLLQELVLYPDGTSLAARFEIGDSGREITVDVSMLTGRPRRMHGST